MESIAALSLACNVIQVIDFGKEAVQTIHQIYKNGVSIDHARLEQLTKELQSLNLDSKVNDPELQQIAQSCKNISKQLSSELSQLKAVDKKDVVPKFIRALRKKDVIEKLKSGLADHERHLNTGLLVRLRSQYDVMQLAQTSQFQALDVSMKVFVTNLASGVTQIEDLLRSEGQLTRQVIDREHTATRALIADNQLQNVTEQQKQQFLGSLKFPTMNARRNQISENYPRTFEWIYASDNHQESFPGWLKSEAKVYFIEGKAASGKSTLMKFLITDDRTRQHLRDWNPAARILSHYFWLAGDPLQRNLHGCLASLIHQIFVANPDIIPGVISTNKQYPTDWSKSELMELLTKLTVSGNYCIFLDGLDEFDEAESDTLLEYLHQFMSQPNTKLCLSSRPNTYYQKQLQPRFGIRLQDLNQRDIEEYVWSRLGNAQKQGQLANGRIMDSIVSEIVNQAQGVFLWVHLALSSVLRGLRNYASLQELLDRVRQLPPDIDRLYEDMLQRHGYDRPLLQSEIALYLKLAMTFDYITGVPYGPPSCYSYVIFSARLRGVKQPDFDENMLLKEISRVMHRVVHLCAGFLELTASEEQASQTNDRDESELTTEPESHLTLRQVEKSRFVFTHRTARDFFTQQPTGQSILRAYEVTDEYHWQLLVESAVIFSRCGGDIKLYNIVERALNTLDVWFRQANTERPVDTMIKTMIYMTDALFGGQTYIRLPPALSPDYYSRFPIDLIGTTLEMGWPEYFEHCLQPHIVRLCSQSLLRQEYIDYLLFCACRYISRRREKNDRIPDAFIRKMQDPRIRKTLKIIDVLIQVGANIQHKLFIALYRNKRPVRYNALAQLLCGFHALHGSVSLDTSSPQNQYVVQDLVRYLLPMIQIEVLDVPMQTTLVFEIRNTVGVGLPPWQATFKTWPDLLKHSQKRVKLIVPAQSSQAWEVDQTTSDELMQLWNEGEKYVERKATEFFTSGGSGDWYITHEASDNFLRKLDDKVQPLCSDDSASVNLEDWLQEQGYLKDPSDPAVLNGPIQRFEDGVDTSNLPSW